MAHAAVVSLMHTVNQIRHGDGVSDPDENQLLVPLLEKLSSLLNFLEESSQSSREEVKSLERKIRATAYHAEDVFESCISDPLLSEPQNLSANMLSAEKYHLDLQKVMTEIDTIMEEVMKIKDVRGEQNLQQRNFLPSSPAPSGQTKMVGFAEDLTQIMEKLCDERQSNLQFFPIVGMGGMGKTTLTMNVYNDSYIKRHFHIRAWVTLSQQYRMRDILLSLLDDFAVTDCIREEEIGPLKGQVYKNLKGKRYLIVVDDLWRIDDWNDIKMLFPDDKNGSRIILTSRLKDVADYLNSYNSHHQMRFLDAEESWNLFLEKVFGEENCPLGLVDAGKKITENCEGLPLLIVVIGGLLSKMNKAKDFWEYVAENLSSIVAEEDVKCSERLALSYKHLPAHLKACFLYMGVFPENYEIPVSRLVKLWVAEGFLKPRELKPLEEVAREYLGDLIDRNLILVRQRSSINGKVKTCVMHGLLRELCVRMAHKEEFLLVKSRYPHVFSEDETLQRRLSIHDDSSYSPNEEDMTMQSMSLVRSFIYIGWDETQLHSYYYFGCRLLRVLDMIGVELTKFPDEIPQLINLRYIAITCHDEIPSSIALLKNLQTLIVEDPWGIAVYLPEEIFNMPQLRHLKLSQVSLLPGFVSPLMDSDKSCILENLETLLNVQDLGMSKHLLEKIPNVKKLGIIYTDTTRDVSDVFVHLQKLETLKIFFELPTNSIFLRSITSPPRLKKITLERGRVDWEYMTILGKLPNLEVLKLREFAFMGPEWIPTEGEFLKLKVLLIWETDLEQWRADSTHFPRLEHLILKKCSKLVEIPSDIGEILTLKMIEIDDSSPSTVKSAEDMLEGQKDNGNDVLKVLFHQTKERLYPLKYGIQQDESGHFYRRETKLDRLRKGSDDPSGSNTRDDPIGSNTRLKNSKRNTAYCRVPKPTTPTDGNDINLGNLQVDPPARSRQVRWSDDMDGLMITSLVEQVLAGHKRSDNGFTSFQVSKAIERVLYGCGVVVSEKNVRSRLKTLKKEHAEVHQLLSMSGFGLDPETGRIVAEPIAWDEFIKGKPEFGKWKTKLCPRYEEMETIFGNDAATGDRAVSGFDSFSPMNVVDESVNEVELESMDTGPSPVHSRKRSAEEILTKNKRRRKQPTDESTIALLRIADSSTKIANAMEMQATIDTLNHVNWQLIVEKLENMNLDVGDVMQVMKSFRSDNGLAKVFMNLTSMKYMRALVFELLGRDPPPLP